MVVVVVADKLRFLNISGDEQGVIEPLTISRTEYSLLERLFCMDQRGGEDEAYA